MLRNRFAPTFWRMPLALLGAVASGAAIAAADTTAHVEVIIDYDAATGELPEGVAVNRRGEVFVSLAPLGEVRMITRDGSESTLASIVPPGAGNGVLGLALDARGNVYAAAGTFNPGTSGVYKISPDGSFARLPGTSAIGFPNGLAFDKRGNLYVTAQSSARFGDSPSRADRLHSGINRPCSWATEARASVFRLARTGSP